MDKGLKLYRLQASESRRLEYIVAAPTRELARLVAEHNYDLWRVTDVDGDEDDYEDEDEDNTRDRLSPNTKPDAVWSLAAVAQAKANRAKRDQALSEARSGSEAPSLPLNAEPCAVARDEVPLHVQNEAQLWRMVKAAAEEVHNQAWQLDSSGSRKNMIADEDLIPLVINHIGKLAKDQAKFRLAVSKAV